MVLLYPHARGVIDPKSSSAVSPTFPASPPPPAPPRRHLPSTSQRMPDFHPASPLPSAASGDAQLSPASAPARRPDPGSPTAALISWVVIVVIVGGIALMTLLSALPSRKADAAAPSPSAPSAPSAAPVSDHIPPATGMISSVARLAIASPPAERVAAAEQMLIFANHPADELRIVLYRLWSIRGDGVSPLSPPPVPDPAIAAALAKVARSAELGPTLRGDVEMVQSLLDSGKPVTAALTRELLSDSQRQGLIARHGAIAQLVLLDDDDAAIVALRNQATVIMGVLGLGFLGFIAVVLASIGLFITAVVLLALGKLQIRYQRPAAGGSVYLETFALFLLGFVGLMVLGEVGLPGQVIGILRWALLGIALWPLARGVSFTQLRHDLGWTAGGPRASLGPVRWLKEIALGIVGYLALLPLLAGGLAVTAVVLVIMRAITGEAASAAHPLGDQLAQGGLWAKVSLVILATIWAPVIEETFFRGALFRHLSGRMYFVVAALICGVIFAALHPQGVAGIPVLTMAGFNFCMLRQWRGGLIAPMTAHALNNGTVVAIVLLITS